MMNEVQNDVEVYATFQNILCWWFIFVVLDAVIWGVFMSLHSAYIAGPPQRGTFIFSELLLFPLLGILGKIMLLQSPCLLIFACFFRKKLLLLKRHWLLLPTVSLFVGFSIMLLRHLLDDGLHETIRLFRREFFNFRDFNQMMVLMSLVSTIIATVPWAIYLGRRFKGLKQ